jgi:hypothetical protein
MKNRAAKAKQTYSIYRDERLIASNCDSLNRATKFVRKDALDERSADRFPVYTILGTTGLKWSVVYEKGKMRWDEIAWQLVRVFVSLTQKLTAVGSHGLLALRATAEAIAESYSLEALLMPSGFARKGQHLHENGTPLL